jgi:hypothetical protein
MRVRLVLPLSLALLAVTSLASPARAAEGEHKLGLAATFSTLPVSDKDGNETGAGAALHYAYGISDAFNVVAEAGESIVALDQSLDTPTTPHTRPASVGSLGAGVVYTLDVLRIVPYGGVLLGGYWLSGGTLDHGRAELGAQLALGVDYKINLRWSIGVGLREHFFVTDRDAYTTYTQLFGKVEYAWGR